jgi:hypothetical protein
VQLYQKFLLIDSSLVGEPSLIPDYLNGLLDADLANLSWSDDVDINEFGCKPVMDLTAYDPRTETKSSGWASVTLSTDGLVFIGVKNVVKLLKPTEPLRVSKMDFARLFTLTERVALNKAKTMIRDLTVDQRSDLVTNYTLLALEVVLDDMNLPAEFIELDNQDTMYAVNTVLVAAGILTSERAAAVLSGTTPT